MVKILCFDVFGSVVDWRSSIIRDLGQYARENSLAVDIEKLADGWRARYAPMMQKVRSGGLPWTSIDDLHYMALEELLTEQGLEDLSASQKEHMNNVWHRLDPWPDSLRGLELLKDAGFEVTPLSNGNR